jgi:hypothetical protein
MTSLPDTRLGDLAPTTLTIRRGFPTQRALTDAEVRVMSVAALRRASDPRYFADRGAIADVGLDVAQPGDVLVSIEGGTVGETLVVDEDMGDFVPSQQVATLRVLEPTRLDPWYLGAWLSTDSAQEQLRRLTRGSGIQRIPIKDLSSLSVPVPPIAQQHEISKRYLAFEAAIRSHRSVTACLEELRDLDLVAAFASGSRGRL